MSSLEQVRNALISQLLTVKDQKLLTALQQLLYATTKGEKVELTKEQMLMLEMAEDDLKNGRVLTQKELFERERKWLKEQ